jgi:hypothetical protein
MQEWQKDILSHGLSIRDNIEKSTASDLEIESLGIIEKAFESGKVSEDLLIKAKNAVFNK